MVDTAVVTHVARAAAERAAAEVPVVVAPTMHFGVSHHHLPFAGTMSLTSHLYVESLKELIRGLHRNGLRRLVLLNGHGGNQFPNGVVAHDLANEEGLDVAIGQASYWTIAGPALEAAGAHEVAPSYPGHAGGFETSLMLALRPDLVQLDRRRAPAARLSSDVGAVVAGAFARSGGTSDDAAGADAAAGRRLLEATVASVAAYLVRFHRGTPP
jgi:creatinine amidohydrolase